MAQFEISNATELQALFAGTYNPGSGVVTLQTGDVIKLAPGTYAANITINKGVAIEGPNDGISGSAARAAEAIITGSWTINSTVGVTIDGVKFLNEKTIANGAGTSLLVINPTGVTHVVENSVFERDPTDNPPDPAAFQSVITNYAIRTQGAGGAGGGLTIQNNLFTGQNEVRTYANDVWANAIWSEGSTSTTLIAGNEFENTRAGINAANFNANTLITGNTFHDMGTAITFGSATTGVISTVTGNIFASDIDTELNLKNLTGAADISGIITGNTFSPAAQPMWIETGAGADTLQATSGADTFVTYKEGGADTAVDKVIYSDTVTSLTRITGGWEVTSSGNTNVDTLRGVDIIDDAASGRIMLVGPGEVSGSGGFATINGAIAAAQAGDTIVIAPGTYAENVVVSKANLTLKGAADGVVIQGTAGIGVDVAAPGVTLQNLKVSGFATNIELRAVEDITIDDLTISGGTTGVRKATTVDVNNLTITNTTFENLRFGVYFGNNSANPSDATNVEITHSTFTDISFKGIYVETLSNAVIDHIEMTRVGQFGGPADEPSAYGKHGNGIDLNLKYGDFTDITISNFDFQDVGLSNGNIAIGSHENGAAIAVKIRTDGSYGGANAATFDGAVVVENGTIDGTSTGIRAGEAGTITAGPALNIINVEIVDALHVNGHGDVSNLTTKVMSVDADASYFVASTSTGTIDADDGVLEVGGVGGFATIQAAIDAAQDGDTIHVAAGTYVEKLIVNKANLTIEGGDGVVIKGTFNADNGAFGGDLSDWIGSQLSYNGSSGAGVTVRADGFTLKDVKIDDFYQGVRFDTDVDDASLTDVDIENSLFGLHKTTTADVIGLTITRGSIIDGYQGTDFTKSTSSLTDGQLKDVTITGTLFRDLSAKGIYTEALADALITGITMTDVGVFGRGDSFGNIGEHGAGIDINLKSGNYSDITIQNFTFTDVGTSNGAGTSHNNAGAITIKARNDAPSYDASPATFTGAVIIRNGTIDGASTGIRVGEEGKTVSGPRVSVTDVKVTDFVDSADHGAFINDTTSPMSVVFTAAGFIFDQGTGSGVINFTPYTAPAPDPEPDEEEPAPPPPPPPPPNPGQGPGAQLPDAIIESFDNVTGVDPTSEKASQPTIILPNGEEIPNPIYEEVLQMADLVAQLQAGLISEEAVIDKMVEFATDTTAVALQAYQFFTGATPTKEGVTYLVNSDDNENDLTDPYYANFSPDNRYINFAVSLGTGGEGAANFEAEYGQLSFEDAVKSAYDTIIGLDKAEAAGINVNEAIAYVMAQLAYFTALGGSAIGAKAAMVGFLMFAGMNAKVGVYYEGTRGFLADAFKGDADYNVDLTGGAGSGGFTSSGVELDWA